jgi:uncharacterized glyoxalase superfamily protein PhnB
LHLQISSGCASKVRHSTYRAGSNSRAALRPQFEHGSLDRRGVLVRKPILDQINVVSGNLSASIAFYRRLGVEIPDDGIWNTPTGAHHATAAEQSPDGGIAFDLDSSVFARHWNAGWKDRSDLSGRIVIGFGMAERADVDDVFRDMTGAGYRSLQEPHDAFWGSRYAIIEDPDGIAVGLMSPMLPEKKSPPPMP